jgi:ATP-binding cassette subfamily A (ABC1) protein 3
MAPSPIRPKWQRIYRQTIALVYKNLLIFYKAPVSTILRTLIFPIVLTVVLCELIHIDASSPYNSGSDGEIANSPSPVKGLGLAIKSSSSQRLVFVRNGLSSNDIDPIIDGIVQQPGMGGLDTHITDDPDDLFTLCKQSLGGRSTCFAAVIFLSLNNTDISYSIALDSNVEGYSNPSANQDSLLSARILPLQWAIDSSIGNFTSNSKPSEQAWSGSFYSFNSDQSAEEPPTNGPVWLALIGMFVGPVFILMLIGVVYHLSVFVATERQTTMSELMQAQMVTDTPRILSTIISFLIIYFPGFLICSILLTQLLFKRTSDILLLFLTLLAGTSITVSSHFLGSFFGKAQLAGLYTSTLAFALALITLAVTLTSSSPYTKIAGGVVAESQTTAQITALSLIFPPYTWATLIEDVANREYVLKAFSLAPVAAPNATEILQGMIKQEKMHGYLYIIFFIVQIIVYGAATYGIERKLWGVKRTFDPLNASSDVALRCTSLSKTYHASRAWYWPFKKLGTTVLAVDKLDLEVKKGSVTFLLGPNGGGKTTTLKCAAGMISMDKGSKLEINEAGVVFGICPQQNVSYLDHAV